jgi:RNA recognition motif-containing protein
VTFEDPSLFSFTPMAMGKRAVEENEQEIDVAALAAKKAAKKARKAAAAAAPVEAEVVEEDPEAAALAAKKAAKKAKKAAAAAAPVETEVVEEDPEAAALAAKKAAKKAKKAAAAEAAAEAEAQEAAEAEALVAKKAAKKAKKAAAAAAAEAGSKDEDEAPPPKKQKKEEAAPAPKKEESAKATAAEDEEFKDTTYKCSDCSEDWVDTADDQQFRWDKGFAETPKRCKDCRWAKKVRAEGGDPAAKGKGKGKGKGNKEFEVFVGGLPFTTTEEVLKKDFAECGEIVRFAMPLNDEGNIRGIAFIEYANMEAVEKALKFHETEYGGRYISVRKSGDNSGKDGKGKGKGKDGKGKGNKEFEVFVGGLPFSATEETFKKDFEECGEIVNLRMPLNDEGKPRGIAFVEYKDKEACDKALKFNETEYGGRTLNVRMSGDGGGKDGKGKDKGKGKGKKGKKGKASSESFAKSSGAMVESTGTKQTFADSDDE